MLHRALDVGSPTAGPRVLLLTAALLAGCGSPQRRPTPVIAPADPSPGPASDGPVASPDRSVCRPDEREDVFSLACGVAPVPEASAEERKAQGWPNAAFALVCSVVEPCGRIPARDVLDPFFLDNREYGTYAVSPSGRSLRVAFSPGDPSVAGDCTPRFFRFRTPRGLRPAPAADWGGMRSPNLLDVRDAVRGTQTLLGDLELTTFTVDMTPYCRAHPDAWR